MARPLLAPGDTVGVVATGFAVRRDRLASGVAQLCAMGFGVRVGRHALDRLGYLAGTDRARVTDFVAMLRAPAVRAIWFARGGYGTARILESLPWDEIAARSKPLIGYSDMTALFAPALSSALGGPRQRCLYAPGVAELGDGSAFHRPSLAAALSGTPIEMRIARRQVLVPGRARGRLVGGNLCVLTHLLGTRFAPEVAGKLLFLEDVGEESYRVDRMLTHLRQSGALSRVKGVLLGAFVVPKTRREFPRDRPLRAILAETFAGLGVPVVTGVRAGHVPGKWTLPLGGRAEIDTAARTVRLLP
jgi:muramoyltetrapeptide carboxypeptidase